MLQFDFQVLNLLMNMISLKILLLVVMVTWMVLKHIFMMTTLLIGEPLSNWKLEAMAVAAPSFKDPDNEFESSNKMT